MNKIKMFCKLLSYMGNKKFFYFFALVGTCLTYTIVQIFTSLATREFVDYILNSDVNTIIRAIVFIIVAILSTAVIYPLLTYKYHMYVKETIIVMRKELHSHIQLLPQKLFDDLSKGDLITRLNNDISIVENIYGDYLDCIVTALIWGLGSVVVLFKLNVWMALYIIVLGIAYLAINTNYMKRIAKLAEERQENASNMSNRINDVLSGIEIIKTFCLNTIMSERFNRTNAGYKSSSIKLAKQNAQLAGITFAINILGSFGTILIGSYLYYKDLVDYGSVIAAITLQNGVVYMFLNLGSYINQMQVALVGAKRILEILEEKTEEKNKEAIDILGNECIEMKNIEFSYQDRKILNNVSIKIKKGEKVVIIGPSGSGKSTILKLLLRFYEPDGGDIFISDVDAKSFDQDKLRSEIGYVPQESYIFKDSIKNNIIMDSEFDHLKFEECKRLAVIENLLNEHEKNEDTVIGEGEVSGGEKQRLGIARACYNLKSLYLLDEATSALDNATEEKVLNGFMKFAKDKTVIMVTHRFSSLKHFERFIYLNNGVIEEIEIGDLKNETDFLKLYC